MKLDINDLLAEHKIMFDKVIKSTELLYRMALNNMYPELAAETDNRQRLISIIAHLQNKIEIEIDKLDGESIPLYLIDILNEWKFEFSQKTHQVRQVDRKIVDLLTRNKDQISKEIAHLFKDRELFKGYNLTNVKR